MMKSPSPTYRFGTVEFCPSNLELRVGGKVRILEPKSYRTLAFLVENPGRVVSKEEILRTVWADTAVTDNALTRIVAQIRRALEDDPREPKYIETIPTVGYRFIGRLVPDEQVSPFAAPTLPLPKDRLYIVTPPERGHRFAAQVDGNAVAIESHSSSEMVIEQADEERHEAIHPLPAIPHRTAGWKYMLAAGVLVVLIGGSVLFLRRVQPIALHGSESILIADFTNTTGDPVFDGTLRQGLSVQLEQSPFLSIVSEGRIQQTLRMMGQAADAKLTPPIARELCQREGSEAVLEGSIAQVGTRYLLTLKAIHCPTGDTLASTEAQAVDKNHVLDALGKTASEIRNKLGESLSTMQRFDTPLEQATTGSLEALQAYSLGRKASAKNDWPNAIPFFQRAVAIDPGFAMAYSRLGTNYRNLGEVTLGSENLLRAYELREQVSESEKFYIESHYYDYGLGNLEKAVRVYETWAQTYPRDWVPRVDLCVAYADLGELDKSLSEGLETIRLMPTGVGYVNLFYGYFRLGRWKEARATAEEAQAKHLDSYGLHGGLYYLSFLEDDAAGMAQQSLWARGKPGVEDGQLNREALTAAYFGKQEQARDLSRQAAALARRAEETEVAARYEGDAALREALFGNRAKAIERAEAALEISKGWEVQCRAALALAFAGSAVRAGSLADDLVHRFPDNTLVQSYYSPMIRAQLALVRNDPSRAIKVVQAAAPYELSFSGRMYSVYVRGESYLAAHRGDEAAAEFQKILEHRGGVINAPIGALAHLGLGRAYALSGDTAKARTAYQNFLTLWKDADPDIPILKQARAEYEALK